MEDVASDNDSDSNSGFSSASSIADEDFLGGPSKSDKGWPKERAGNSSEEEENEAALIRESIAKRNIRDGKELLKKTSKVKGKGKAKAEMGGGSFQSMGVYYSPEAFVIHTDTFLKVCTHPSYEP